MYSNGAGNECRTGVDLLKTTIYTTAADVRQEFPGSSHMLNIPNGADHAYCTHSTPLLWSPNASITDLGSAARHQTPPLSTISQATISAPTARRENISRLFVENIFEDPPEICYTKGHFVFIGPFGTVRIMKCFNFTHFSAAIFSGSLLSPSGE